MRGGVGVSIWASPWQVPAGQQGAVRHSSRSRGPVLAQGCCAGHSVEWLQRRAPEERLILCGRPSPAASSLAGGRDQHLDFAQHTLFAAGSQVECTGDTEQPCSGSRAPASRPKERLGKCAARCLASHTHQAAAALQRRPAPTWACCRSPCRPPWCRTCAWRTCSAWGSPAGRRAPWCTACQRRSSLSWPRHVHHFQHMLAQLAGDGAEHLAHAGGAAA